MIILGCALGACGLSVRTLRESGLPERAAVEGVPVIVQTENHCGPASLTSLLRWSGIDISQEELAPLVYTPQKRGAFLLDLIREVRFRGRLAYRVPVGLEALLAEVAGGNPVLVLENRGLAVYPVWHYSVVVGFDLAARQVVLHDGARAPSRKPLRTFAKTWARGGETGLLALPPGRLPMARDPEGILSALADLEEVGRPEAAAVGYAAYLQRWPGEWRAAFGRGNALCAQGDGIGAGDALRTAHRLAPDRPEPLNNLALLAWESGDAGQARALAEQALAEARTLGVNLAPYADTVRRVTAAPFVAPGDGKMAPCRE